MMTVQLSSNDDDDDDDDDDDTKEIPQFVSVIFYRNNAQDLPIKLEQQQQLQSCTKIRVTEVYLTYLPIEVGDVLVSVHLNGKEWPMLDLTNNTDMMGTLALQFQKDRKGKTIKKNLRESFFVQPQAHTCLPMAIDVQQKEGILTISRLELENDWISHSCLEVGQSIVAINGTPSHHFEEEKALNFLMTKLTADPYLSISTTFEEEMSDEFLSSEKVMFQEFLAENKNNEKIDRVGDYNTLSTSKQLFLAVQKSLLRIEDEKFYSLSLYSKTVLSEILLEYSLTLEKELPRPITRNVLLLRGKKQQQRSYRLPTSEDIVQCCHILATCEYCASQTEALQDVLRARDESDSSKKNKGTSGIFLTDPIVKYHELISMGMTILISGVMNRLEETAFSKMRSSLVQYYYWKIKDVEEESPYVQIMCREIQSYVSTITETEVLLPPCYLRTYCDKFVIAFCTTYYDTCHRIILTHRNNNADSTHGSNGIQQLLVDIYHLKRFCLLQHQYPKNDTTNTNNYTQLVEFQCSKIETLLKKEWQVVPIPGSD